MSIDVSFHFILSRYFILQRLRFQLMSIGPIRSEISHYETTIGDDSFSTALGKRHALLRSDFHIQTGHSLSCASAQNRIDLITRYDEHAATLAIRTLYRSAFQTFPSICDATQFRTNTHHN